MPATKPIERAAQEALATYLTTALGASVNAVVDGWPEYGQSRDASLADGPVVSVYVTRGRLVRRGAALVAETVSGDPDDAVGLVRVGDWTARAQITFWAVYKAQLDEILTLWEDVMNPDSPWKEGLDLTMASYFNGLVGVTDVSDTVAPESEDEHEQSVWTMRYTLELAADALREFATTRQDVIQVDTTMTIGDNQSAEVTIEVS